MEISIFGRPEARKRSHVKPMLTRVVPFSPVYDGRAMERLITITMPETLIELGVSAVSTALPGR